MKFTRFFIFLQNYFFNLFLLAILINVFEVRKCFKAGTLEIGFDPSAAAPTHTLRHKNKKVADELPQIKNPIQTRKKKFPAKILFGKIPRKNNLRIFN